MDTTAWLRDLVKIFRMYKTLGDQAMAQIPNDAAFGAMLDPDSNSVAIIVQHIAGNLRSRYRDFLTTDGEKPDRDRDREFEMLGPATREGVLRVWNDGWAIAFATL